MNYEKEEAQLIVIVKDATNKMNEASKACEELGRFQSLWEGNIEAELYLKTSTPVQNALDELQSALKELEGYV